MGHLYVANISFFFGVFLSVYLLSVEVCFDTQTIKTAGRWEGVEMFNSRSFLDSESISTSLLLSVEQYITL